MKDYLEKISLKKYLPFFLIVLAVILLTGTSYALLKSSHQGENTYVMKVGLLEVTFVDSKTSNLTLENAYPITDAEGINQEKELVFTVKNTGDFIAAYDVYIEETSTNPEFKSVIRFISNKNNQGYNNPKTLSEDKYISKGNILDINKEDTYKVKAWISEIADSTYMNKTFTARIVIDNYQTQTLDKSGANLPKLLDNMIPVYYEAINDTEGIWKIADRKNLDSNNQWFDYDNFMWANAITVKENGTKSRKEYLNSSPGTEVDMDDILSMWVWIPRYKYTIFNGNNAEIEEQLINVVFESETNRTGTVTCVDNIQTADDSSSSEICTDETNGSIVNGISTYTHPAFTFDNKELTGFWFAKFETATDDESCNTQSITNCNKSGFNILIKPNQQSLRYINLSNLFKNIRGMELSSNIHGFSQSENTTLNNDGTITNDNNNFDIHMLKNMEWGAVAYLSHSKYGKYGNDLYTGAYKQVYLNNYNLDDIYKTGFSGGSYNVISSSDDTYLYNNLTISEEGAGYKGAGASTTGNIYGVYDMNGGSWEMATGNMVDKNSNFYPSNSGTWSSNETLADKYYNKYSYSLDNSDFLNRNRGKLGDATTEVLKIFNNHLGHWYGDMYAIPFSIRSWFLYGGRSINLENAGIFAISSTTGIENDNQTTRAILCVF